MAIRNIIIIISALFFVTFNDAFAFEPNTIVHIGLKESIDLAKKKNIDMGFESLDIEKTKNNIKKANRLQNPGVFFYNNFGPAGKNEPQLIGLSQPVELWKRSARKGFEQANLDFVKERYGNQLFALEMAVREAYINLVVAKSILTVTEEQQELLQELLSDLERINDKNNEEARLEIMQAEIALNLIIAKMNTAKANVENARLDFNKILNIKNGDDITYDTDDIYLIRKKAFLSLMTPDLDTSLPAFTNIANFSFKNRLDLKVKKSQVDLAEKKLTLVIRQRIPDLEISSGYSFQYANQTEGQGHLSGAFTGVSLVNIPVFYDYTPEIKNARIELEQAWLKYESTKNIAEHQLKSAYEKFKMAKKNLSHFDQNIIEKSDEVLRIAKKSFKEGKSTIMTFILIEQSHIDVEINYIESLAEYYRSWINLLKAIDSNDIELSFQDL